MWLVNRSYCLGVSTIRDRERGRVGVESRAHQAPHDKTKWHQMPPELCTVRCMDRYCACCTHDRVCIDRMEQDLDICNGCAYRHYTWAWPRSIPFNCTEIVFCLILLAYSSSSQRPPPLRSNNFSGRFIRCRSVIFLSQNIYGAKRMHAMEEEEGKMMRLCWLVGWRPTSPETHISNQSTNKLHSILCSLFDVRSPPWTFAASQTPID